MDRDISDTEYCLGHRRFGGRSMAIRAVATMIATVFAMSACGGSDSSGPDPITVTFRVQPSGVEAGVLLAPAVEVATSSETRRTVTLSIADNDCGASLAGEVSRVTVDGVATFSDLAIDIPADGFTLEARVLDQTSKSTSFNVGVSDLVGSFRQHPTVCLKDRPMHGDAASLTWVPRDDLLWIADDNKNQVFGVDRQSGVQVNSVSKEELLAAFPDAANCDDGDGNPTTTCSYTNELEVVTYNGAADFLYVFNTVNDPSSEEIVDRPAVFRLRYGACRGCVEFDSWKKLPGDYSYRAAVAIEGELYISNGRDLHQYDFETNTVTEEPALRLGVSAIEGLSIWDRTLYVVTHSRHLVTVDWEERLIEDSYDLSPVDIVRSNGVEVVRDTIYVLEGEPRNPIFVVMIDPDQP